MAAVQLESFAEKRDVHTTELHGKADDSAALNGIVWIFHFDTGVSDGSNGLVDIGRSKRDSPGVPRQRLVIGFRRAHDFDHGTGNSADFSEGVAAVFHVNSFRFKSEVLLVDVRGTVRVVHAEDEMVDFVDDVRMVGRFFVNGGFQ